MKDKFKEMREWLNLGGTLLGPIIIGSLLWAVNTKLDNQRMTIQAEAAKTYVTKEAYDADRNETNKRLDMISADISTIKIDIATMKGRQSRNNNINNGP